MIVARGEKNFCELGRSKAAPPDLNDI